MAFSSDPTAKLGCDFFHLLRRYNPHENILFSPLNLSGALQVLDIFRRDSAGQFEMLLSFDQDKDHIKEETRWYSEEPTSYSTSEATERWHFISVQEAFQKPPAKELFKAKENIPFLTSKQDVGPTKSYLTHVLTSATSPSSVNENLSSHVSPWSKCIPKCEALEVQNQKEISPEGESFYNQHQSPEIQHGMPKRNLGSEDVRLPSFYSLKTVAEDTLLQPSNFTAKHAEDKNPERELEIPSSVFSPASEVNYSQPGIERSPVKAMAETTFQSKTKDFASHLLTRDDDKVLRQNQSSLEKYIHQNQVNPHQEGLSHGENMAVSASQPPSPPALLKEAATESLLKTLFQEFKSDLGSIEMKDPRTEDTAISPSMFPLYGLPDRLTGNNLIQTLADTASSEAGSEDDISSEFVPWSDNFSGREDIEILNQSPAINVFHNQKRVPKPQTEFFSSDPHVQNTFGSSRVEGDAKTILNDAPEMDSKSTLNQEGCEAPSGEEGTSNLISQANARPTNINASYTLNHLTPELVELLCCLPWNKYLQGREKRKALIYSCNCLRENAIKNQTPLEIRRYGRYTWVQNSPLSSGLTRPSYKNLLRSTSS